MNNDRQSNDSNNQLLDRQNNNQVDNQIGEKKAPSLKLSTKSPQARVKNFKLIRYCLFASALITIGVLSLWIYQQTIQKKSQYSVKIDNSKEQLSQVEDSSLPADEPSEIMPTVNLTANKIFYSTGSDIFIFDAQNKETVSLLDDYLEGELHFSEPEKLDDSSSDIFIRNIRVIDENKIAFSKCSTQAEHSNCGIYLLDLQAKQIIEQETWDTNIQPQAFDWHTTELFAYLITFDEKWQLYLNTKDSLKILEDLEGFFGRGGANIDSNKIRFSPDGEHVMQISTGSPRDPFDFNIYIYQVSTDEKFTISNASQPAWMDNERIVYKQTLAEAHLENEAARDEGLYIYNIVNKTQTKLTGINEKAYRPEALVNEDKILYENYADKQIWLYDLATKDNRLIADKALYPIWLNSNKIVYYEIELFDEKDERRGMPGGVDYERKNLAVYDLVEEKSYSIPESSDIHSIATQHN